jgi:hypothetical protein
MGSPLSVVGRYCLPPNAGGNNHRPIIGWNHVGAGCGVPAENAPNNNTLICPKIRRLRQALKISICPKAPENGSGGSQENLQVRHQTHFLQVFSVKLHPLAKGQ